MNAKIAEIDLRDFFANDAEFQQPLCLKEAEGTFGKASDKESLTSLHPFLRAVATTKDPGSPANSPGIPLITARIF